jgi:hypothetical protein
MHERYLGDSYDLVKRFWGELLSPIAPVLAHPRFIPSDLRDSFTRLTNIPMWDETRRNYARYSLLLDPHTGIPMPEAAVQGLRISHAPVKFIVDLFNNANLAFIICFDQTTDRQHDLSIADQREAKREAFSALQIVSFYYLSHAPFLFASNSAGTLNEVRNRILDAGIPEITSSGTRVQKISVVRT